MLVLLGGIVSHFDSDTMEEHMKRHRRNRAVSDGTGPCETYDAACGERASSVLKWCEEKYKGEYLGERSRCADNPGREDCEAKAYQNYRDKVLACVGD